MPHASVQQACSQQGPHAQTQESVPQFSQHSVPQHPDPVQHSHLSHAQCGPQQHPGLASDDDKESMETARTADATGASFMIMVNMVTAPID